MKIKTFVVLFIFCMQFSSAGMASQDKAENSKAPANGKEIEYEDCKVMLIDHEAGFLGFIWRNSKTEKEEKRSFKVDLKDVYVTDMQTHVLEFSDISAGDTVDIYTKMGPDGKEEVTDIWAQYLTRRGDK